MIRFKNTFRSNKEELIPVTTTKGADQKRGKAAGA